VGKRLQSTFIDLAGIEASLKNETVIAGYVVGRLQAMQIHFAVSGD